MRLIEEVSLQTPLDRWLPLPALSKVVGLSVCTLRAVCTAKTAPLPYYRMNEPRVVMTRKGKHSTATGKILVRWSEFARWMEQYHYMYMPSRNRYAPALDVDRIVEEVVEDFQS